MIKALYICYFGLREPLVGTQVLPYLRELRKDEVEITLLTFEPNFRTSWSAEQIKSTREELAEYGIDWHMLPYHKRPSLPATAFDVLNGTFYVRRLLKKTKVDILHARVHIPALIAVLARKFSRQKPKILFDIRGFVPEEYADAGVWKKDGLLFRLAKGVERWIMKESDGFVVLTEAARKVLFPESETAGFDKRNRPVEVIPCCVDLIGRFSRNCDLLRTKTRNELGLDGRYVIIHVGALVGLYLTSQIIEFLSVAKRKDPSVFALFLTQSDPTDIVGRLYEAGFSSTDFLVKRVDQEDVPAYLCASDLGLSFVRSSYATISRSPTKIPEYLACGLPVIANSGVGDVDQLIATHQLGAIVEELNEEAYERAFSTASELDGISERACRTAFAEFDLENVGGLRYRRLYARLAPRRKTLYICYFGLREPLVQTQVLPYLGELTNKGRRYTEGEKVFREETENGPEMELDVSLLTFEREKIERVSAERIQAELKSKGINWHWLRYHKRPSALATAYDVACGAWFIWWAIRREEIDTLHGRAHIATLMGAIARKLSKRKPKLLFDIRGFFPEEYTDAGIWPENGWLYRSAKRVERWLLKESDGFVVLTEKAREILFPESKTAGFDKFGRPVEVIPCCVDLMNFTSDDLGNNEIQNPLALDGRFVVAYVGSFGGWYLTEQMMDFFEAAREFRRDSFIMILTQRNSDKIIQNLNDRGFSNSDFFVASVKPNEVFSYLVMSDIAISFIKPCYSKLSSSPTKFGEYLASGVPVISNRGVGDIDSFTEENKVGVLLDAFTKHDYLAALNKIDRLGDVRELCRTTAVREFDLQKVGGESYRRLYRRMLGNEFEN